MNEKAVPAVVTGIFLLSLGPLWVYSKGGAVNAFNLPPTVEVRKSSPLISMRVVEGDYLIIDTALTRKVHEPKNVIANFYSPPDAFTVTATDSTGQNWNLPWRLHHAQAHFGYYSSNEDRELFISLPEACPPDVKWYDVTLHSKWGDKAVWRFSNFQIARHLMEDEPVKTSITFDGITVSGKAERFYASNSTPRVASLKCSFSAKGKSASGKSWSVRFAGTNREWEIPSQPTWTGGEDNRIVSLDSSNSPLSDVEMHGQATFSFLQQDFSSKFTTMGLSNYWTDHYPERNHFARLAGAFVLIQKNGQQEQIQQTIPFTLKVPIVFKAYKRTTSPNSLKKSADWPIESSAKSGLGF